MPIRVVCPACEKAIRAPDEYAGKLASCPACGSPVAVPAMLEPPAAEAPPIPAAPPMAMPEPDVGNPFASPRAHSPRVQAIATETAGTMNVVITGFDISIVNWISILLKVWVASLAIGLVFWLAVMSVAITFKTLFG